MRSIPLALAFACIAAIVPAQEVSDRSQPVTLEECIEAARRTHPDLTRWRSLVEASAARIGQARALRYPSVNLSAGYLKQEIDTLHPRPHDSLLVPLREGEELSTTLSFDVTLLDFGRISNTVATRETEHRISRLELATAELDLIYAVKVAYFAVLATQRARDTAVRSVAKFEDHLEQARAFHEAGLKPRYDVTKAEVDLSNERLTLAHARSAVRVAWVRLASLTGLDSPSGRGIADTLSAGSAIIRRDEAVAEALANRPELHAARAHEGLARHALADARKEFLPTLGAGGSTMLTGPSTPLDRWWSADIHLSLNLFSGFATRERVAQTSAELRAASAAIESARLAVTLEIDESLLDLQVAAVAIDDANAQVALARDNLELAQVRYESGVGNPIEVTDALVTMSRAESAQTSVLYEYKTARARLDRAMGSRE